MISIPPSYSLSLLVFSGHPNISFKITILSCYTWLSFSFPLPQLQYSPLPGPSSPPPNPPSQHTSPLPTSPSQYTSLPPTLPSQHTSPPPTPPSQHTSPPSLSPRLEQCSGSSSKSSRAGAMSCKTQTGPSCGITACLGHHLHHGHQSSFLTACSNDG